MPEDLKPLPAPPYEAETLPLGYSAELAAVQSQYAVLEQANTTLSSQNTDLSEQLTVANAQYADVQGHLRALAQVAALKPTP